MRIDASGNVGIGVTPTQKLDVVGTSSIFRNNSGNAFSTDGITILNAGAFTGYNASIGSVLSIGSQNSSAVNGGAVYRFVLGLAGGSSGQALTFSTATNGGGTTLVERVRFHSGGGVSIGNTTDPGVSNLSITGTALTLGGSTSKIFRNTVNGSTGLVLQGNTNATVDDTNPGAYIDIGGGPLTDTFEGNIRLVAYGNTAGGNRNNIIFSNRSGTNAITERMRIFSSGGVSIANTTDPGAGNLSVTGTIRTQGYTVATLPAAGTVGRKAYVTDALAPTFLAVIVGGGAVRCPVFDNGTAWVAG
jgi:hypothetical protein